MAGTPDWLIECLGVDDTVRLIEISGGLKLWVPNGIRNSSVALRQELDTRFGKALAQKLVRFYGGGTIKVPLAKAWRTAIYHTRGMSPEGIARELQWSYDTVLRRLNRPVDSRLRVG